MTHPRSAFLILVATTVGILLFASNAEAKQKNINPWCKTSDYRALCTKMVGLAKTQVEATRNAIQSSFAINNKIKAIGLNISDLPDVCQRSYENALDNLKDALKFTDTGDRYSMVDRIQVTESGFAECIDELNKVNLDNDLLIKTTKILFKYASNTLAVALQIKIWC